MNLFESVKSSITTREAAEHYGIHVGRSGMCRCPFHNDRTPSMKVDERFHCFGCQADGDVISFTSRLFDLSPKDAALELASDLALLMTSTCLCILSESILKSAKKKGSSIRRPTASVNWQLTEISWCNGRSSMLRNLQTTTFIPDFWKRYIIWMM